MRYLSLLKQFLQQETQPSFGKKKKKRYFKNSTFGFLRALWKKLKLAIHKRTVNPPA